MKRLHKAAGEQGTAVATAAASLPFPPLSGADVSDWNASIGCVPEFDLEITSSATSTLTNATIYGGVLEAQVLADDNVDTVDFANNELDLTGHAYETGDGPVQLSTTGTLPSGLATGTDYYVIKVNANSIKLATSRANALAGTAVAFTDAGSGTHTISDTATTERIVWHAHGLLGQAADGSISLTASKGYTQRLRHRPRVVAYAVDATISAGNISLTVYPALEQ